MGGTITGEHGIGLSKKKFFEKLITPGEKILMQRLKTALDPNGILNPGKVFDLSPKCEGHLPNSKAEIDEF